MATQMYIDLSDVKKLEKDMRILVRDFPKLGEKVRRRLAKRAKTLAKANVQPRWGPGTGPFKYAGPTGKLKGSIVYRKESATSTMLMAEMPYAGYVEMGTKKHPMKNNWYWGLMGHPGARAMKFMQNAYFQVLKESDALLQDEVSKFFSKRGF